LTVFENTTIEKDALAVIAGALKSEDGLCAKWMPRKGSFANKLRNFMSLSPKQYRKILVGLTNVVETAMCSKDWDSIQYGKIPSLAASRYQKAFHKNDGERYRLYIEDLKSGKEKINASAVYPYDVLKSLKSGIKEVASEQWKALPNYMDGSEDMVLPVVDVSGSMETAAGGNPNVTCMDVAVSLGLYISERNEGPFKDAFITFSGEPSLQILKGDLSERYSSLRRADWAMNTDLQKVFRLILDQAKKNNVDQSEMPTKILILSDMEFDEATESRSRFYSSPDISEWNPTAQEMIKKMYEDAGYRDRKSVV
jgi:hypothetical protein